MRWRREERHVSCHGSPRRRRLGVVIDSRGASYCRDHVATLGILLQVGYPD